MYRVPVTWRYLISKTIQAHRPELDLECFGCHSHFSRAGAFWEHLENNECKVIFPSDIVRLREKNLEFAKQLELRRLTLDDSE